MGLKKPSKAEESKKKETSKDKELEKKLDNDEEDKEDDNENDDEVEDITPPELDDDEDDFSQKIDKQEEKAQKKVFRRPGEVDGAKPEQMTGSNLKMLQQSKVDLAKKETKIKEQEDQLKELCK